jgi:hypothetical protein
VAAPAPRSTGKPRRSSNAAGASAVAKAAPKAPLAVRDYKVNLKPQTPKPYTISSHLSTPHEIS